jgi:hypothetical protein
MDVKTAFLNAKTDMDIYVEFPLKWKVTGITDDEVALLF